MPRNIVSRVIFGESWQERNNTDYLYSGFGRYLSESHPQAYSGRAVDDDDHDDGRSIISISTNATADDLPGTGRTVDMHIFQPMGRWIERVAMRFTIASLHPAHIAQYIRPDIQGFYLLFRDGMTLHNAIAELCSGRPNGSTVVAGFKGLVKQTQSNSIERSVSALAALIRVSLGLRHREIYANVSRIEPIFHLETLVRSHPDKKWLLFLVKLARETLIAIRSPSLLFVFDPVLEKAFLQLWPSPEAALNLRQRFIRVSKVYRLSGLVSLDNTIGEACAICAEAASTCIYWFARGDAYMDILDTVYFTFIFILRSNNELTDFARTTSNRHIHMVLQTIACWVDAIVYHCLNASALYNGGFDMDLLKADIAFRSLALVGIDTKHILLPESFDRDRHSLALVQIALPRRHREATGWDEEAPPIQSLIEIAKQRTRRLLRSFDELDREVLGCTSQTNHSTSQLKINAHPYWNSHNDFGDEWWKYWKITLGRARREQLAENELTEEFREARRSGSEDWVEYQLRRLSRHKWGQYLRSNMDWDWDLGTCMRRLFRPEKQARVRPSAAVRSPLISSVDAGLGGTWEISTGETQPSLPKEVRVAYKTVTGETEYMTFLPAVSGTGRRRESFSIGSPTDEIQGLNSNPVIAQEESGSGKESFAGDQETEDTDSSS